jgi:hypothetical protein
VARPTKNSAGIHTINDIDHAPFRIKNSSLCHQTGGDQLQEFHTTAAFASTMEKDCLNNGSQNAFFGGMKQFMPTTFDGKRHAEREWLCNGAVH